MWKFKWFRGKDKWLFLLTVGVILCILAFPVDKLLGTGTSARRQEARAQANGKTLPVQENGSMDGQAAYGQADGQMDGQAIESGIGVFASKDVDSYEKELERRVKELLSHVDGVGEVDVMIVLESSAEKVWQSDGGTTTSLTEEKDSGGGSRRVESREMDHSTVLVSGDGKSEPMLTKELRPQISGIIISAAGGGSPAVQAEISAAMEALFGLPAHKIKVLKRIG